MTTKCGTLVLVLVSLLFTCARANLRTTLKYEGHYYELHDGNAADSLNDCINFGDSRNSPGTSVTGHPTCITSSGENTALRASFAAEVGFDGWDDAFYLWATDTAAEDYWVWGCPAPENGLFSIGSTPQNGFYTDWGGSNPNDINGQDYGFVDEYGWGDFDDGGYDKAYCFLEFNDYDECLDTPCSSAEICTNTVGSYTCTATSTSGSSGTSGTSSGTSGTSSTGSSGTGSGTGSSTGSSSSGSSSSSSSSSGSGSGSGSDTDSDVGANPSGGGSGSGSGLTSGGAGGMVGGIVGGLLLCCCLGGLAFFALRSRGSSGFKKKESVADKINDGYSLPRGTSVSTPNGGAGGPGAAATGDQGALPTVVVGKAAPLRGAQSDQLATVRNVPISRIESTATRAGGMTDDFDDALSDLLCDSTLVPITRIDSTNSSASLMGRRSLGRYDDQIAFVEEPYAGDSDDEVDTGGVVFEEEPFDG